MVVQHKIHNKQQWKNKNFQSVLQRPLEPKFLTYAAYDVLVLWRMYVLWGHLVSRRVVMTMSQNRGITSSCSERMCMLDFNPSQLKRFNTPGRAQKSY